MFFNAENFQYHLLYNVWGSLKVFLKFTLFFKILFYCSTLISESKKVNPTSSNDLHRFSYCTPLLPSKQPAFIKSETTSFAYEHVITCATLRDQMGYKKVAGTILSFFVSRPDSERCTCEVA